MNYLVVARDRVGWLSLGGPMPHDEASRHLKRQQSRGMKYSFYLIEDTPQAIAMLRKRVGTKAPDPDATCLRRISSMLERTRVVIVFGDDTSTQVGIDLASRIQADLRRIADRLDK